MLELKKPQNKWGVWGREGIGCWGRTVNDLEFQERRSY